MTGDPSTARHGVRTPDASNTKCPEMRPGGRGGKGSEVVIILKSGSDTRITKARLPGCRDALRTRYQLRSVSAAQPAAMPAARPKPGNEASDVHGVLCKTSSGGIDSMDGAEEAKDT